MWLKTAEFAEKFGVNIRKIQRIVNKKASEKILRINTQFFAYANTHGKGGKSGRVLMIWDTPFESEGEAAEFALSGEGVDCHEPNGSRNDELPQNSQDTQNDKVEVDFTSHSCASRSHVKSDGLARNDELPQNSQDTHPQTPFAKQGALMDTPQTPKDTHPHPRGCKPCETKPPPQDRGF